MKIYFDPILNKLRRNDLEEAIKYFNENSGGGGGGSNTQIIKYTVNNYSTLPSTPSAGEFAYVINSQGTQWLPGSLGGTYYPGGLYYYTGSVWVNDLTAIAGQLAVNDNAIKALQSGFEKQFLIMGA